MRVSPQSKTAKCKLRTYRLKQNRVYKVKFCLTFTLSPNDRMTLVVGLKGM